MDFIHTILRDLNTTLRLVERQDAPFDPEIIKALRGMKWTIEKQMECEAAQPSADELAAQLKTVTDELVMQIALRFNTPELDSIRTEHPIVKKALDTLKAYRDKPKL